MIQAPNSRVWRVLLEDGYYRKWSSAFDPGSHFIGTWEEGSTIIFKAQDGNGLSSKVVEHHPEKMVMLVHQNMIIHGEESIDENEVNQWAGFEEIYSTEDLGDKTQLTIQMDANEEDAEGFEKLWDQALQNIQSLAESES